LVGIKVPASVVVDAVKTTAQDGSKFVTLDNPATVLHDSVEELEDSPVFHGIFKCN